MSGVVTVLEVGRRRTFASALDWPGWSRSARSAEAAVETLAAYAPRYAPVVVAAGLPFDPPGSFDVVETLPGDAGTDFGVPGAVAALERADLTAAEANGLADLMVAAWAYLVEVGRTAPPVLRKGPRGGGRDRDAILAHVWDAEAAYARRAGLRLTTAESRERPVLHAALVAAVRSARSGAPTGEKLWPVRYAVRRVVWHVLDHAWEIEDRSEATP
ncbi:MAG TPA: hypothetical protein VMI11_06700 [Actinomycetes bacterium]|nr:hypothetical protein [Actinomycetes bacterium]